MYERLITALQKRAIELPEKFSKNALNIELFLGAANAIKELQDRAKVLEKVADKWCEAMPKWIPVTERLPKENTSVLVYRSGDNRIQPTMRIDVCPYLGDGIFCMLGVTHWMPLPEPPKDET